MTIITLTTDFGTGDGYVGAMKGVILALAPQVTLIDLGHNVPPQDIHHAARLLATAAPFFPNGTIHAAVVDPGVGSARRGIALRTPVGTFVGPDNGLFTPFLREWTACFALTNPNAHRLPISDTFHGRDIFAPVAAHLANGMPLTELGPAVKDPVVLRLSQPQRLADGRLMAEVVHVDHFGNLITNVGPLKRDELESHSVRIVVRDVSVTLHHAYAHAAPGALLAVVGSAGYLEIAVRDGSAADRLGVGVGAVVKVRGL